MSFEQIIGQDITLKILRNSLKEKRRGLTYLFYGPPGTGKSFTARQFAKATNCLTRSEDSCDTCSSCLRMEKLEYPDLHWLDLEEGSNNVKIEQVRSLRDEINLKPFEGRAKIFIIDNCQNLTTDAANCLLKTVEEPPADSIIILITSDLRSVIPTISSRALKLRFSRLNRDRAAQILKSNADLNDQQVNFLSRYSEGRACVFTNQNKNEFLRQRENILNALFDNLPPEKIEDLFKNKDSASDNLHVLISCFRDMLFVKAKAKNDCLINQDKAALISKEADKYTASEVLDILENLNKSFEYLKRNMNLRLVTDNIWLSIYNR